MRVFGVCSGSIDRCGCKYELLCFIFLTFLPFCLFFLSSLLEGQLLMQADLHLQRCYSRKLALVLALLAS